VKEPVSITLEDNKRPDGTTPFHRPQGIQWLGTSQSQTHTLSHTWLIHVHCKGGSLSRLPSTPSWQVHMFYPIAKETAGTWDDMAIELVQEIVRRSTVYHPRYQRNTRLC